MLCNEVETPYTIVYCIQHTTNSANCRDVSGLITEDRFVKEALLFILYVMKQTCHYHLLSIQNSKQAHRIVGSFLVYSQLEVRIFTGEGFVGKFKNITGDDMLLMLL